MRIIVVDDEYLALEGTLAGLKKVAPEADVRGFRDPGEVIEAVREEGVDVAFLDIEMRSMSGFDLAVELRKINPAINIIFTTGFREYMEDAFGIHVSGYILKPVTPEKLEKELNNLRFPIEKTSRRMRVQTFGEFEVFVDDQPLAFSYAKTKELFAYLIDANGAMVTNGTLMAILWEDDMDGEHRSYLRNLVADLMHTLKDCGCDDVILRRRGVIGVDKSKVSCDYYDLLKGDETAARSADGEYMLQYSWAEVTHGAILQMLQH
ncbi:MAG: response regulator [Eubacterium sp.]|nr:response regulator [Eubacterium sp.]